MLAVALSNIFPARSLWAPVCGWDVGSRPDGVFGHRSLPRVETTAPSLSHVDTPVAAL